jgi:hypothetical protein
MSFLFTTTAILGAEAEAGVEAVAADFGISRSLSSITFI